MCVCTWLLDLACGRITIIESIWQVMKKYFVIV